jgi:hypothetical protein
MLPGSSPEVPDPRAVLGGGVLIGEALAVLFRWRAQ